MVRNALGVCNRHDVEYYNPEIILADRDQVNPHPNNKMWCDSSEILKAGFLSYTFPQAEPSRDLLVWSKK